VTDANGITTTFSYDSAGNLLSASTPLSGTNQTQTWSYSYGDSTHPGDMTKVTDPDGNVTNLTYDTWGDLASATDAAGDEETLGYDTVGRRTSMVSPDGNAAGANPASYTTSYNYDPANNLLKVTDPLGHSTSYTYDPDQNLSTTTDADGNKTSYTYDVADQLTTITRADGSTLTNGYDNDGNLTSQTDGLGHTTSYGYDALDRVASVTDPLSRTTSYTYDGAENLITVVDPAGRTTTYTYDAANRPTAISYSDGRTPNVSYGYDNDGQRTSMIDGTGSSSYTYDSLHRLTTTTDGAGHTISYGYDLAGNETSITYPNGKAITQTFDPANRLASITDWLGGTTSFTYDADSNLTATTFPSATGDSDSYGYNDADQLTSIGMSQGTTTVASLSYIRDPLGLISNEIQTGLPGAASTGYTYNQLNQLATAGTDNYSYDKADNITELDGTSGYNYDNANELTSSPTATYAYDQLGERTSQTPTGGSATTYGYDQAGRLTSYTPLTGTATTFAYNGDGLRTTKTTGTSTSSFTWDQTQPIPSLLGDGQNYYIYGSDGVPIEQINQVGTPTYLHQDQLGSTRLITNESGATAATFTYNPYGTLNASTGTATTPFGYAGQYTDPETGLQYDRARYYDPTTGQFLTRDPLEAITGAPYFYGSDNPLNELDPSGLDGILGTGIGPNIGPNINWGAAGMAVSNAAAGALNTLTFGLSTKGAGAVFGFNADCANFGTAGQIGGIAAIAASLLDGEGEAELATEDAKNPIERIYEPNPKHGPEPYIDSRGRVVSKAPTNGQGALDNSSQIKPTSPTRQGIDPDTGETVILPRHGVQNFPDRTVEYYHGYVP